MSKAVPEHMLGGAAEPEPPRGCPLCPRLVAFRHAAAEAEPSWHNAPVPSFGDPGGRLLIVGLAPGLKGANRTGRPFTGDYAGDLLYATLARFGWLTGDYAARPDDGIELVDCMISNAVRCVPPANKPVGTEIATCRRFLAARIATMPRLQVVLALGRIAHQSVVAALGARQTDHPFGHGATNRIGAIALHDSYHCSRYNTNTGRLTEAMFEDVFAAISRDLERPLPAARDA